MSAKRISAALLVLLLLFFPAGRSLQAAPADDWIARTIDLTINTRFKEAESLLRTRIAAGDSSADVYFYLASVFNSKMTHFENHADEKPFLAALNKVLLKTAADSDTEKARALFYRGSALGYKAFYEGQSGNWFDAVRDGLKSVDNLKRAIDVDSTLYDACLGIGVYQYWRSTKLKFLLWMPFIEDTRLQGIKNIRKAAAKSKYSRYMAMHQLIYILLNYGNKDEALHYAREVIRVYPNSTFMWWAYAHTRFMRHEYPKALTAYRHLLTLLTELPEQNASHVVSCRARMAEIYDKMGKKREARQEARRALEAAKGVPLSSQGQKSLKKAQLLLAD